MDTYADLSYYYDLENAHLTDDIAFYTEFVGTLPPGPVLDLGCGSGRVTFPLAAAGYTVVGVDNSPAMLARAHARLAHNPKLAPRVSFVDADVTTLALPTRARCALWAFNGFMHLLETAQQQAALTRIAAHLLPGARLVLDIPNPSEPYAAEHNGALTLERTFVNPETGATVHQQASTYLDRAAQRLSVTWFYDEVAADGVLRRRVVPLTLRYTFPAEMRLLLAASGLRVVGFYGDYDGTPFDDVSERFLVVAEPAP